VKAKKRKSLKPKLWLIVKARMMSLVLIVTVIEDGELLGEREGVLKIYFLL
jgi:hypothetical protein